jgi:hypothetical protein
LIWIKSVLVGLAVAILAIMVGVVVVPMAVMAWMMNVHVGEGTGGIGAVSFGSIELVFLPAIIGFALGFLWAMRRGRRKDALSAV